MNGNPFHMSPKNCTFLQIFQWHLVPVLNVWLCSFWKVIVNECTVFPSPIMIVFSFYKLYSAPVWSKQTGSRQSSTWIAEDGGTKQESFSHRHQRLQSCTGETLITKVHNLGFKIQEELSVLSISHHFPVVPCCFLTSGCRNHKSTSTGASWRGGRQPDRHPEPAKWRPADGKPWAEY